MRSSTSASCSSLMSCVAVSAELRSKLPRLPISLLRPTVCGVLRLAGCAVERFDKPAQAASDDCASLYSPIEEALPRILACLSCVCVHIRHSTCTVCSCMQAENLTEAYSRLQGRALKAMGRSFSKYWRRYQNALDKEPVKTKALTSCCGLILADVIAQIADPGVYDPMRTMRMAAFGLGWHGIAVCSLPTLCPAGLLS